MLGDFCRWCNRVATKEVTACRERPLGARGVALPEFSACQYSIATLCGSYGSSSIQWIAWSGQVSSQTPQSLRPYSFCRRQFAHRSGRSSSGTMIPRSLGFFPSRKILYGHTFVQRLHPLHLASSMASFMKFVSYRIMCKPG